MESTRRSDWITARSEYIDPLDERFPDHPYREQTQAWRDKIALDEAEGRAKMLASPTPTPFSQPQTNGERQFAAFHALASKAEAEGDELTAERFWREMIGTIAADDPDDRRWVLLAQKRADDLGTRIQERRAFVQQQVLRAVAAMQAGRPREAAAIQGMLREKYGRYTDLADFFAPVPGPEPEPEVEPSPPAETAPKSDEPAPGSG
jgi:serine/threonine-protein kinase